MSEPDQMPPEEVLARLRASEELYARAFMSNPVAMSVTDLATGRFTHINTAFSQLLGYQRAEIIGKTSEEMRFWPDRGRREAIGAAVDETDTFPLIEGTIRRKDGQEIPILVSFRLLPSPRRSILSVLVPLPQ